MVNRTIVPGAFDGVHRGHRFLISKAREFAGDTKVCVLTFAPHPALLIKPQIGKFLLSTPEEKESLLLSAGAEEIIVLPFEEELRNTSPREFIEKILLGELGAKRVVVGEDFRFGRNKRGNPALLKSICERKGVETLVVPPFCFQGEVVKSEKIRKLIGRGEVGKANTLLGYFYSVKGKVTPGEGIGRSLGYPTANLESPSYKLLPSEGVYAVKVRVGKELREGICYVGRSPTLLMRKEVTCEVHIFDMEEDLVGSDLRVFFLERLRGDRKFPSVEALREQLARDIRQAKHILSQVGEDVNCFVPL